MDRILLKDLKKVYKFPGSDNQPLSIFLEKGVIQEIDYYNDILKNYDASFLDEIKVVDCSDCIALPGFVDSHTHLLFAGSREQELYMRADKKSYLDIMAAGGGIFNTVKSVRTASDEELIEHGLTFLDKALSFGTTTIEIKSGYGLDYATEEKMLRVLARLDKLHPIDIVPTFLVHGVPKDMDRTAYLDIVAEKMIPEFKQYSDWFDLFLEKGVIDKKEAEFLFQKAMDAGYSIGFHTNQMYDIGGVELALKYNARRMDHLEVLDKKDAKKIKQKQSLYPVFLPSAEYFVFSENVGKINLLDGIKNRIVLATDFNPGSSPVLSPQVVMSMAVLRYGISDPYLLIDAFTSNPAKMLYMQDRGELKQGAKADIVCMQLDNFEQIPYYGTINFIKMVIKDQDIFTYSGLENF